MSEQTDVRVEDWNRLQREVARLRMLVIIALLAVIALAAVPLLRKPDTPTRPDPILRAQGLVITDAQGHDRILIGAPVPASKDRVRKDDASDGIIFLGATGADRLALGQMPAPFIGGESYKRIGDGDNYGLTLYDPKGNERGGMGYMGMGRAVFGLDRATPPYDAIGMMVDDKEGFAGMIINYGDPKAKDTGIELGTDTNSAHIKLNGKDGLPRAQLNLDGTNKPAWRFDDAESAAKAVQDQKH
ncbi:hypothetical protein RHOFW510R12_27125 [Rhodanobacter sp. FW510-R12]|uniref:hypothetical protein n=2 Tax=Rhodanobacteraceae TaxID=1775411 RepID=UPI00040BC835|nr:MULTISPECIES: hypothetical protein [Rhodanobacter]TAN16083.1 MAG: hypothetical protein EPN35_11360 [Rhodanobacter sp.]UJJ55811.1 hypothetical protein LRK53_05350 [Rhodanobacter thiooxydans]